MEETTAPICCDRHYFVPAKIDEISIEEDRYGRTYGVVRFYCPVAGCGATANVDEADLAI